MEKENSLPRIIYSCYDAVYREGEHVIPDHVISIILSGSQIVHIGGEVFHFKEGDIRFFRKNQLSKFIKQPPADGEFKSLSIRLDKDILHEFSSAHGMYAERAYNGSGLLLLKPVALLKNFVNSLAPYVDGTVSESDMLTRLKINEAIMILLQINPDLKNILFDFNAPGKIDLEKFMSANYKYNVDLNQFAYLTGRSLATFKRDFKRIYNISPSRWVQLQRLNDAYFLIKEKGLKVSDIYLDVGFKDLSHFSFAFKKAYGIAPTQI